MRRGKNGKVRTEKRPTELAILQLFEDEGQKLRALKGKTKQPNKTIEVHGINRKLTLLSLKLDP